MRALVLLSMLCLCLAEVVYRRTTSCPAGKFNFYRYRRRRSSAGCKPCPRGMYMNMENNQEPQCWSCLSGEYSDVTGAVSCKGGPACDAGTFGKSPATSPEDTACRFCPTGKYQPRVGMNKCYSCPGGMFANVTRQMACWGTKCEAGYVAPLGATAPTTCRACAPMTFAPLAGSDQCMDCPHGMFQNQEGHAQCIAVNCTRFYASVPRTNRCELRHAGIRILAGVAWLLLVLSIYECCQGRGGVSFFAGLVGLGVGIEAVIPVDSSVSDAAFYTMVVFVAGAWVAVAYNAWVSKRGS